jgi:magnesium-transporting ATPase (P-type)
LRGNQDRVRVYVKGAPEFVIPLCNSTLSMSLSSEEFLEDEQKLILDEVIGKDMAGNGYKPISIAFKEIAM